MQGQTWLEIDTVSIWVIGFGIQQRLQHLYRTSRNRSASMVVGYLESGQVRNKEIEGEVVLRLWNWIVAGSHSVSRILQQVQMPISNATLEACFVLKREWLTWYHEGSPSQLPKRSLTPVVSVAPRKRSAISRDPDSHSVYGRARTILRSTKSITLSPTFLLERVNNLPIQTWLLVRQDIA